MRSWLKMLVAAFLATGFVLWSTVGWAAGASSPSPPPLPMAISGTVDLPNGNPLTISATVSAFIGGQAAGSLTFQSASGAFGGTGLSPQLLVQGTSSTSGDLSFAVTVNGTTIPATATGSYSVLNPNGTTATESGPIAWSPGTVISGLTLQLQSNPPTSTLTIVSPLGLPGGAVGQSYTFSFQASGGIAPYTWSATGTLPPGLTLQSNGTLSGTPRQAGPFFFGVTVTDQAGHTTPEQVEALNISPSSVPPPKLVAAASSTTASTPAQISLSVPSGPTITGSASGGTGTVAVAAESQNPTTVNIQAATSYFDISLAPQSSFTTLTLNFCNLGGATTVYWFNGATWEPASDQTYDPSTGCVTVSVTAATSPSLSDLTGTAFAAVNAPIITTTSLPPGEVGQPYSATLSATGGTPPYTWALAPGSQLPPGLSLSPQGTISGTPMQAGTTPFTVTVTNTQGLSASASLAITVNAAPPVVVSGGGGGYTVPTPAPAPAPAPTTPTTGPTTQSIGAGGGSLTATASNGTQIGVSIPAGAVSQTTSITITPLSALPSSVSAISVVQAVDLAGAPLAAFSKAVTVTLTFTASPGNVDVVFWNNRTGAWQPIANVNVSKDTVTFPTRHFTVFAVVAAGTVPMLNRVAGSTRLETAMEAAEAAYPEGSAAVVLASAGQGTPSPDALAAAGLAGALNCPILLTEPDHLSSAVLQTIKTLGASTVYVVGGPAAVSDAVVKTLSSQGLTVIRDFEGLDRFQTAALIDAYLYRHHLTDATTVYIANGVTMVDALSASPALFAEAAPLILINSGQTTLPAAAFQAMEQAHIQKVVILGGPAAVSTALQQAVANALPNATVVRYGGATRNQTAALFDRAYFGSSPGGAVVAANGSAGGSFVDALSAAPLAGTNDVPILLTNPDAIPSSTAGYLAGLAPNRPIWVMGGPAAVSDSVMTGLASSFAVPSFPPTTTTGYGGQQ